MTTLQNMKELSLVIPNLLHTYLDECSYSDRILNKQQKHQVSPAADERPGIVIVSKSSNETRFV